MARKPETTWWMFDEAFQYYRQYIENKDDARRYELTLYDLLYVSNFKGGNAAITEKLENIDTKLEAYSKVLNCIAKQYCNRTLRQLTENDLDRLIEICSEFIQLSKYEQTKIKGFGPSYASAVLCAYFPDMIPILDRRVLNGAGVKHKITTQGQVKNLPYHYPGLIRAFHKELNKQADISLRDLDRIWFSKPIKKRNI